MRAWLVVAAVAWPAVLSAALVARVHRDVPIATAVVYAAASRVCHQRPDRSFSTAGAQWPVCGRCAGLYLAAPFGAIAAWVGRKRRDVASRDVRPLLLLAALPTALTLVLEWGSVVPISSLWRFVAAVPLGAAIAWVLVGVAAEGGAGNRVH